MFLNRRPDATHRSPIKPKLDLGDSVPTYIRRFSLPGAYHPGFCNGFLGLYTLRITPVHFHSQFVVTNRILRAIHNHEVRVHVNPTTRRVECYKASDVVVIVVPVCDFSMLPDHRDPVDFICDANCSSSIFVICSPGTTTRPR